MQAPSLELLLGSGQILLAVASLIQLILGAFLYPRLAGPLAERIFRSWGVKDHRAGMRLFMQRETAATALADYALFVTRASMILQAQGLAFLSFLASSTTLWLRRDRMTYADLCFYGTFVAGVIACGSTAVFLWRLVGEAYDPVGKHSARVVQVLVAVANLLLIAVRVVAAF